MGASLHTRDAAEATSTSSTSNFTSISAVAVANIIAVFIALSVNDEQPQHNDLGAQGISLTRTISILLLHFFCVPTCFILFVLPKDQKRHLVYKSSFCINSKRDTNDKQAHKLLSTTGHAGDWTHLVDIESPKQTRIGYKPRSALVLMCLIVFWPRKTQWTTHSRQTEVSNFLMCPIL